MDLTPFFPIKKHSNYNEIKGAYKKGDINEMLRSLYAQYAIEKFATIAESLNRTSFQ